MQEQQSTKHWENEMKLIDLLVKELPHRGGWPEGALNATQDKDGQVCFSAGAVPEFGYVAWEGGDWLGNEFYTARASDYATAIITCEQYEAAIAASKAVVGHDGWIQWAGGECPVDSDAIVEVRFRNPSRHEFNSDRAGDFYWSHHGFDGDIIAYRLQQPTKSEQACDDSAGDDDEADLNECIGKDVDIPEWNGEGLPPVGTICEYSLAGRVWSTCKIDLYVGTQGVVISCDVFEGIQYVDFAKYDDFEFRPLRTEAERAREDAETAIRTCLAGTGAGITPLAAKGIYDAIAAGKIPGVKLEGK
jgi:NADH:ubiquinone oxidoreductase subunit|nr:MAG TPA: hypothetical protein [Caudoviricetes sp.]